MLTTSLQRSQRMGDQSRSQAMQPLRMIRIHRCCLVCESICRGPSNRSMNSRRCDGLQRLEFTRSSVQSVLGGLTSELLLRIMTQYFRYLTALIRRILADSDPFTRIIERSTKLYLEIPDSPEGRGESSLGRRYLVPPVTA